MEALYLNGHKVDLYDTPITRNIQIGDVGDIASRKSSYSYTVKLPRTANNIAIFDLLGVNGSPSRKPYEKIVATYVVDTVPIIHNGTVVVTQSTGDYSINLLDGVLSLSEALGDKTITELDFSELVHDLTRDTFVSSFANTEGYIYALANFGKSISSDVLVTSYAPCIYTHTVLAKIFEANNIVVDGDFFETNEDFLGEVITPSYGYDVSFDDLPTVALGSVSSIPLDVNVISEDFEIVRDVEIADFSMVNFAWGGGDIICEADGRYKFNLLVNSKNIDTVTELRVYVDGSRVATIAQDNGDSTIETSIIIQLLAGQILSFDIEGAPSVIPETRDITPSSYTIIFAMSFNMEIEQVEGEIVVNPIAHYSDVKQIDLLVDVARRYGLIIHPTDELLRYRVERLDDVLAVTESLDWSTKLSVINSVSYQPSYSKVNNAKYNYPENSEALQDGKLIIDNANLTESGDLFTSIFEVPNEASSQLDVPTYSVPIWSFNDDNELENSETPIKTLKVSRYDIAIDVREMASQTPIRVTTDVPILSLNNMSMQHYIDVNYRLFKQAIDDYKMISIDVNLSVLDIYALDFFKPIFLAQTGRRYYLDTVQYTHGKIAKVQMLEI